MWKERRMGQKKNHDSMWMNLIAMKHCLVLKNVQCIDFQCLQRKNERKNNCECFTTSDNDQLKLQNIKKVKPTRFELIQAKWSALHCISFNIINMTLILYAQWQTYYFLPLDRPKWTKKIKQRLSFSSMICTHKHWWILHAKPSNISIFVGKRSFFALKSEWNKSKFRYFIRLSSKKA